MAADYRYFIYHQDKSKLALAQDFVRSIDCPLVQTEIGDSYASIIVGDETTMRYSSHSGDTALGLYINGVHATDVVYHNNTFILFAIYSDTFFHLYHASYQWWGGGAKFNYLYEIIDEVPYEGYKAINTSDWDDVHIYDYYMYNKETGQAYKHAKMFKYIGEITEDDEEMLDFSHDVLFDPSGIEVTRIADTNFITCTKVGPDNLTFPGNDRHRIVTVDGNDYISLEPYLLAPLFDPEPEPEPEPNSDDSSQN
jgi:hypothetical protein